MSEPLRVLVVDDDFAVAQLHRSFVEFHGGFSVVGVAHTGAEALDLLERTEPDLVLLDVYLPDMTGLDVLHEIRARPGHHVEVVAITAARELETVRSAMAGGVLHYLVKPFTAQVLRERLDDVIRHRSEIRRSESRLDQEQVDRLMAAPSRTAVARLPKGLSATTMETVRAALRECAEPASAQEIGAAVGISRVSARRYLQHLVDAGRASVAPRYGAAGRPENRYRWIS